MPRVLVVERDDLVRQVTCEMFRSLGFSAASTDHAEEALLLVREAPVDVLLTHIEMSNKEEPFTLGYLAGLHLPDLYVIYTSTTERVGGFGPRDRFLQKPYRLDQLAACLKEMNVGVGSSTQHGPAVTEPGSGA
jgi:CheY-like chemotaxis protein